LSSGAFDADALVTLRYLGEVDLGELQVLGGKARAAGALVAGDDRLEARSGVIPLLFLDSEMGDLELGRGQDGGVAPVPIDDQLIVYLGRLIVVAVKGVLGVLVSTTMGMSAGIDAGSGTDEHAWTRKSDAPTRSAAKRVRFMRSLVLLVDFVPDRKGLLQIADEVKAFAHVFVCITTIDAPLVTVKYLYCFSPPSFFFHLPAAQRTRR
jgi:hypothetical protein